MGVMGEHGYRISWASWARGVYAKLCDMRGSIFMLEGKHERLLNHLGLEEVNEGTVLRKKKAE